MPPQAQPVASAAPAALPLGSSAGNQQQLWVGYFKRMKPQRVYRLVVEMQPVNGKKGVTTAPPADPVLARPIIPGALVSPAELPVGTKQSNSKATFYVTPLGRGRLPEARVDVFGHGRLIQDVPLRMRCATQRLTKLLLFLAVLVPALLLYTTVSLDWSTNAPAGGTGASQGTAEDTTAVEDLPADGEAAGPIAAPAVPRGAVGRFVIRHVPPMPGYPDLTVRFARELQYGYDVARVKARDHLSFYVFAGLLGLTALSWVAHRPARARRVGKPFVPPAPAGSASPSSPLDFGPAVSHR